MRGFLLCLVVVFTLGGAMAANPPAPITTHPDTTGWQAVFNDDLSNAEYPAGIWKVADGILTPSEDKCIWTKKDYENFILDLEFKNEPGTNSGVFVYCSNVPEFTANAVEVQIADDFAEKWAKSPKTWQCGAIFGHLPATKSMVKKAGEWNHMTVQCVGQSISVVLNGEPIINMDMKKWDNVKTNPDGSEIPPWCSKAFNSLPTKGRIGLQGKHGGVPVYFRNIKMKEIK